LAERSQVLSRMWKQVVGPGSKASVRWPSAATGAAVAERPTDLEQSGPDGSGAFAEESTPNPDVASDSQQVRAPTEVSEQVRGLLADVLVARYPDARSLLSARS